VPSLHPTVGCEELGIIGKPVTRNPAVPGAIGNPASREFWKSTLDAPNDVMDIVTKGYRIPFLSKEGPPVSDIPNNRSATSQPKFVEEELWNLESIGCIKRVKTKPKVIMPLSVVMSNKLRLLGDASRNLNPYIKERKVNLSHLQVANEGLLPGFWMQSCDLESGYYQVPVHPDHHKFLGFSWKLRGKRVYFVWVVLFLGIKDAVYVFTKLLRPHIRFCQRFGIFIVIYIDDQRTAAQTEELCKLHSDFAEMALMMAGWKLKAGKGHRTPVQYGIFLGLDHDLINLKYFVPEVKMRKTMELGSWIIGERRLPLRLLASFYGRVASFRLALGPVTALICRVGQKLIAINSEVSWDGWVSPSREVREEINFIISNLESLNGYPMKTSSSVRPNRVMASDASAFALASAEVVCGLPGKVHEPHEGPCVASPQVQRLLRPAEVEASSTLRELLACWDTYVLEGHRFSKQSVVHLCDNKNVEIILRKGSSNPGLQTVAMQIYKACRKYKIQLSAQWLPRTDSRIAVLDVMSKWQDLNDWGLSEFDFKILCERSDNFDIDLFAADYN
jgi:hypothetical protein